LIQLYVNKFLQVIRNKGAPIGKVRTIKALQVNLEVGERAIPSPKVQNQGENESCHVDAGDLMKLQGQKKTKEDKHDPQKMKDHHTITQDSIEHCGNSPKPSL
jgi:hypothetical protein